MDPVGQSQDGIWSVPDRVRCVTDSRFVGLSIDAGEQPDVSMCLLSSRHKPPSAKKKRLTRIINDLKAMIDQIDGMDPSGSGQLRSVCWVLRNSAGVVPILEHYARTAHLFPGEASLPTRDFERLYTGLPQQDIVGRLSTLLQSIWQLHPGHPFLLVTSEGSQWLDSAFQCVAFASNVECNLLLSWLGRSCLSTTAPAAAASLPAGSGRAPSAT